MWTNGQFWKAATWRCFRTFCQTLAAMLAGQTANLLSAPWTGMLSTAAGAALVSLLMSIDREQVVTTMADGAVPGVETAAAPVALAPQRPPVTEPVFQPPGLGCGAVP